ncbi:NF-kappa-B inhibitor-interacting Ras-like protein 1 [Oppia nitens]|uniref:NF-kappa-B inhibitor-interacting Ras-like protein 1 n=1 Tax=Oppia nitens TaxID=1686743 RepID=UPI0023DAED99|nr:NF-kappa-B inhibitor-interacting Ras-like protein 1 [Oppia nitens]
MKSHYKVVVLGAKQTGKTSILDQVINGSKHKFSTNYEPTIEDIFGAVIDTDRQTKEKIYLFDFSGMSAPLNIDAIKTYLAFADAFILVYAINDKNSYLIVDHIKKAIDRYKDKRDMPIITIGNKVDRFRERQVDCDESQGWAQREKTRLFEVTATERKSLIEPFVYLASKLNPPQNKTTFPQLHRKGKTGNILGSLEL